MASYGDDVIKRVTEEQIYVADNSEQQRVKSDDVENDTASEFCVAETFNDVVSWFVEKLEALDDKFLKNAGDEKVAEPKSGPLTEHERVEEVTLPNQPLNLTIPDDADQGSMEMDKGMVRQLPDLFADDSDQPYVKEKPSASFGGRILMDDAELDGMEEYHLKDMTNAVRGAEVSLEFKTN
jgi:hypothetical protein